MRKARVIITNIKRKYKEERWDKRIEFMLLGIEIEAIVLIDNQRIEATYKFETLSADLKTIRKEIAVLYNAELEG